MTHLSKNRSKRPKKVEVGFQRLVVFDFCIALKRCEEIFDVGSRIDSVHL